MARSKDTKKVALFIDLPNYLISLKTNGYDTDSRDIIQKPVEIAKRYGTIVEAFATADFGKVSFNAQVELMLQGVCLVHCPSGPNGKQGAGKMDDQLLIELIHKTVRHANPDVFVIVSSDTRFLPVIATLNSLRKTVKVVGLQHCASKLLRNSTDFIDLAAELPPKAIYVVKND